MLAQASEGVLAIHSASRKDRVHPEQIWRNSLRDYKLPVLGRKRADRTNTADIMAVSLPHWETKRGDAPHLPLGSGRGLPDRRCRLSHTRRGTAQNGLSTQHCAPLPHREVATAIAKVRNTGSWPESKSAFKFLALTACLSEDSDTRRSRPQYRVEEKSPHFLKCLFTYECCQGIYEWFRRDLSHVGMNRNIQMRACQNG